MNKKKIPVTFRRNLILFNLLLIVCIACTISIYTYTFYRNDAIASEMASSVNRLYLLSSRLEIACDELINIVQNCAGRQFLFFPSTLSERELRSDE